MPYRPHLVSTTTRPTLRPLVQKVFGDFDPLRLDPYLLFDAQSSMLGTLEASTLDLDPSDTSTLDVITATRAGVATFTEPDGTIATAPANTVRVDHTQGAELTPTKYQNIGYTDFSSGWSAGTNLVISAGDGLSGNISKTVTLNNPTNQSYYHTITTVENQVYTGGFWIRRLAGTGSIHLYHLFSATGTQTEITSEITSEWSFVSKEFLGRSGGGGILFGLRIYTQGDSVEIAMPQVEEGTTASSFVANTTGSPKFITGATFGPRVPMILVEPSSENFLLYSDDFSQSSWIKNGTASVASNTTISPDGTLNASTISNATGTSTSDTVFLSINPADVAHTLSVYVKSAGATTMSLFMRSGVTGVILSQAISLTDEWQRVTLTHNIQNGQLIFGNSDGDFHVWGAQFETGSVATSYIPTSGGDTAARTRAADDLVISGSAFTDFYNQSEGTIYVESITRLSDGQPFIVGVDNGDNNRIILYNDTTSVRGFVKTSGSTQADFIIGTRPSANTLNRTALSYKTNNVQGSLNGGSVITDTSVSIATSINRMNIGTRYSQEDIYKLNGHIKRLIYWPTHSDSL